MSHPLGGGAATPEGRDHAREVQALATGELKQVRAAAGRWQAGLAGLSGTIAIFGLVKGGDDVDALSHAGGIAYGILLLGALACSIGAGVLAMRSAFGLPRVVSTSMAVSPRRADAQEARRSTGLLHAAIWMTVASIAFVAAALGVAWYAPRSAPEQLRVHRVSGAEDCGKVLRVANGSLVLDTDSGERSIPLQELDGIVGETSCSAGD